MDSLGALADRNRRELLLRISQNPRSPATALSKDLDITPSAVSQHLKVLLAAGLVIVEPKGTSRLYSVNFEELQRIQDWMSQLGPQLVGTFDRLDGLLSRENQDEARDPRE